MVWRLRASLEDRPGGLEKLAASCGRSGVNILALDVLPSLDGQVTDELVLDTPDGWTEDDLRAMCREAGITAVDVTRSSVRALEDVPVRYLRAVRELLSNPAGADERLPHLLGQLLDADDVPAGDAAEVLTLDDDAGPPVRLARSRPFTDTEWARAAQLRRIVAELQGLGWTGRQPTPPTASLAEPIVTVREGSLTDLDAVRLMHARCSAETLRHRYYSGFGFLRPRLARAVLEPDEGFSLLLCARGAERERVVGMGLVVVRDGAAEAALLVEDRWQGKGFGSRLLHRLAADAAAAGIGELTLLAQPDNQLALARTIARASLSPRRDSSDGLTRFRVPVVHLATHHRRGGQPAIGSITAPLASLLHRRHELRDAVAAADLIDAAIRDGA